MRFSVALRRSRPVTTGVRLDEIPVLAEWSADPAGCAIPRRPCSNSVPAGNTPPCRRSAAASERIRSGIFNQLQFQLAAGLNHRLGARRIAFTRQLHKNFIVFAAAKLNRRLGQAQRVDAALDGFERLRHRGFLNVRDGAGPQCQRVAVGSPGAGADIPMVSQLLFVCHSRGIAIAWSEATLRTRMCVSSTRRTSS